MRYIAVVLGFWVGAVFVFCACCASKLPACSAPSPSGESLLCLAEGSRFSLGPLFVVDGCMTQCSQQKLILSNKASACAARAQVGVPACSAPSPSGELRLYERQVALPEGEAFQPGPPGCRWGPVDPVACAAVSAAQVLREAPCFGCGCARHVRSQCFVVHLTNLRRPSAG